MSVLQIPTAEVFEPLLAPARDKVAKGGRGSGKSHFFAGLMVEDALAEPGECGGEGLRAVCIREVQKDLAQSAKLLIETKLQSLNLGAAAGFRVFEDCIETPGDGLIVFKGMNNYTADSIKSLEGFKRAWWEEAHTATQKSINLLRPTIRAAGSQLWWSYNPARKTDPVDVMFCGAERPTGAVVVSANWRDNPWFTAELEQERLDCLRMQPDQYDHIWEGDYIKVVEGAYFAKVLSKAKAEGRIDRAFADPLLPIRAFVDIGGSGKNADAMAIWVVQFAGETINVLDYIEGQGQVLAYYVNLMRKRDWGDAEIVLPHDGVNENNVTGKRYADHWADAGFETRVIPNQGRGAALMRIEAVRRVFPRCVFDARRCQAGLDALGWYHEKRDDARNVGLGPEHDWASHGADAFGLMAIAYEQPTKNDKPIEIPRFGAV